MLIRRDFQNFITDKSVRIFRVIEKYVSSRIHSLTYVERMYQTKNWESLSGMGIWALFHPVEYPRTFKNMFNAQSKTFHPCSFKYTHNFVFRVFFISCKLDIKNWSR